MGALETIMKRRILNKLAALDKIPERPAISVKRTLLAEIADYSRFSRQIPPFSQTIACLRAGNAGVCVKKQLPGDIPTTAHVLEDGKHEGYCTAQKSSIRQRKLAPNGLSGDRNALLLGMFPFASYFTKRVIYLCIYI